MRLERGTDIILAISLYIKGGTVNKSLPLFLKEQIISAISLGEVGEQKKELDWTGTKSKGSSIETGILVAKSWATFTK